MDINNLFNKKECWYYKSCKNKKNCDKTCIRYLEMKYLLEYAGIPKVRQNNKTLMACSRDVKSFIQLDEIKKNILNYVHYGDNIYIHSKKFGNGKTTWAIKLMLNYFNKCWLGNGFTPQGLFINVPMFLTALKNNISSKDEKFIEKLKLIPTINLVIWDDIAATKLSDFDHTTIFSYIDKRYWNCKSNIFTGNIHPDKLAEYVGNRLSSRIVNGGITIEIFGDDRRDVNGSPTDN